MPAKALAGKAQLASQLSTAEINVFDGSVRSGKTVGTLYDWIEFCVAGPPGLFCMAGRTQRTVINNLVVPMQEWLGPELVKINYGSGTVNILGRDVIVVGANNEQARTKIQGLTLAAAYVDESSTLPESFWDMLVSRLSVVGARMWATCNPEGPRHWFKVKWLDRAKLWLDHDGVLHDKRAGFDPLDPGALLDLHRFSFLLDDNPYLDPAYVARRKASYSGLFYKRMILGQWALAEGAIYDCFDSARHVLPADALPKIDRTIALGIDYGTTNPTAGILLGISLEDRPRLVVVDEWSPTRGTDADLSAGLTDWLKAGEYEPEYLYVDPAAASFKLQLYNDRVGHVENGNNSVVDGLRTVAALFATDRLVLSENAARLIGEIPGYVWDDKASEKGEDKPVKVADHFCDALRYAVHTTQPLWQRYTLAA